MVLCSMWAREGWGPWQGDARWAVYMPGQIKCGLYYELQEVSVVTIQEVIEGEAKILQFLIFFG